MCNVQCIPQPADQMPDAHYEASPKSPCPHNRTTAQGRLDHSPQERRKEERNSSEDGALAFHILRLAPIILEYLIDNPVPASLGGNVAGPLSMRVCSPAPEK